MREKHFGKKYIWVIETPEGGKYLVRFLKKFCREKDINYHSIINSINNKRNLRNGLKIKKVLNNIILEKEYGK